MEEQPFVTIAAINYNNSKFVLETLNSIKAQNYDNIELVVVDDCSTDNSLDLIKEWVKNYDKPYKLIAHDKNRGVCAAWNSALNAAKSKYFCSIATDDIMLPEKTKVQVRILEESSKEVCAVYSDAYLIKEDSSPRYGWFINRLRDFEDLPTGNIYDQLMKGNFIPAMSVMIKMDCMKEIGVYDESLEYEDYDMWLRLARKYSFVYSNYVSVKYRVRKGSLVSSIKDWDSSLANIYIKHVDTHPLAIVYLEKMAWRAYNTENKKMLKKVEAVRSKSKFIDRIITVNKFNVPKAIGVRILYRLHPAA